MKRLLLISLLLISSVTFASHGKEGGAGVEQNGKYQTFYSAGFYTEPEEEKMFSMPQVDTLLKYLTNIDYLSPKIKSRFVQALVPTTTRKYYRVKRDFFSKEVESRLIAEFVRVTRAQKDQLQLFAVTDTTNDTTYFLPEFYELTPTEQQAILYHEAFWLVFRDATYEQTILSEMTFQAQLEDKASLRKRLKWLETLKDDSNVLKTIVAIDLQEGNLEGLLEDKTYISAMTLFGGEDYFGCADRQDGNCSSFIKYSVYKLLLANPNSLFLKFFFNCIEKDSVYFFQRYYGGGSGGSLDYPGFYGYQNTHARQVRFSLTEFGYDGFYDKHGLFGLVKVKKFSRRYDYSLTMYFK